VTDHDPAHRHAFKRAKTIDFCHYQQLQLQCECGAATQEIVKRDFSDHGQRAFADPNCSTCRRLTAFDPTHSRLVL
jgi:hypothetical protein